MDNESAVLSTYGAQGKSQGDSSNLVTTTGVAKVSRVIKDLHKGRSTYIPYRCTALHKTVKQVRA